jgi:hypothetical protein
MESPISEKVQRLTRILAEEAEKFPRVSVSPYSTGVYRYDWTVYLDQHQQLGTISFTTDLELSERELRAAFRHELKALTRSQTMPLPPLVSSAPVHATAQER